MEAQRGRPEKTQEKDFAKQSKGTKAQIQKKKSERQGRRSPWRGVAIACKRLVRRVGRATRGRGRFCGGLEVRIEIEIEIEIDEPKCSCNC